MTADLLAELKVVSGKFNKIIEQSTFPEAVKPAYLAQAMRSYPANGGKRLRPAIMLWSAAAAGGDIDKVLPAAAALEIFHNWTLVHDDIIDDDEVRRNFPTAHVVLADAISLPGHRRKKFGCDMAILAGDLMQAWAFDFIDQTVCSAEVKLKLARELRDYGYLRLVSGEAEDVAMSYRKASEVSEDEMFTMQLGKTGALLHYAARAGWMIGKGYPEAWDEPEAVALGKFGDDLALAFQLRDDYLGVFGKLEEFGKPIGSDLQEGKATLLLIHALKNLDAVSAEELQKLLYLEKYTTSDIEKARELFHRAGSVKNMLDAIEKYSAGAVEALKILPESSGRTLLEELANYLINREK
jgi:geranylgeranyl diphosphate synthase type I